MGNSLRMILIYEKKKDLELNYEPKNTWSTNIYLNSNNVSGVDTIL